MYAPFTEPISSLSAIVSGIAAELTEIKGNFALLEFSCNRRAINVFPVPDSPSMRIGSSVWLMQASFFFKAITGSDVPSSASKLSAGFFAPLRMLVFSIFQSDETLRRLPLVSFITY